MPILLCRNRIADFDRWKAAFDANAPAHRKAGLRLRGLWRDVKERDVVFFLFEVERAEEARAFFEDPEAASAAEAAGVLDGECHLLEHAGGYG